MNKKLLDSGALFFLVLLGILASGTAWAASSDQVEVSKNAPGQVVVGDDVDKTVKEAVPPAQKAGRQAEVDVISIKPKAKARKAQTGKKVGVQASPRKRGEALGKATGMKHGETVSLPGAADKREGLNAGKTDNGKQVEVQVVPGVPVDKTKTVPGRYQKGMQSTTKQGQGYVGQGQAVEK